MKLWYLSSFFRAEAPQAGRYRQFWQVGAEAIGSAAPAVDAELIVLLAELLEALGVKGVRLRLSSLGTPETRADYREELQAYLRAHEDQLSRRGPRADRPEPAARLRRRPTRHARGDGAARRSCSTGSTPRTPSTSPQVRALLDAAGLPYEVDPTLVRGLDYYTRTVFEFTSDALGAQSGVGGGGRYDRLIEQLGGPPTPGCGLGGRASSGCCWRPAEPPVAPDLVDLFVALRRRRAGVRAPRSGSRARRAGPGCARSSSSPAAR